VNHSYKLANGIIEALKSTELNIVEIPQDQNFKMSQILRKTIQQQGAKPETLKAFAQLAKLVK
jgi:hypothetical protein